MKFLFNLETCPGPLSTGQEIRAFPYTLKGCPFLYESILANHIKASWFNINVLNNTIPAVKLLNLFSDLLSWNKIHPRPY